MSLMLNLPGILAYSMDETNGLYKVVYSPAAQEDIRSIYMYIAYELLAGQSARNQVDRVRKKIHGLETMPKRHEAVDWEPWASMGMRKIPVDNYVVFYLVDDENGVVTVDRVFYGGRGAQGIIQEILD